MLDIMTSSADTSLLVLLLPPPPSCPPCARNYTHITRASAEPELVPLSRCCICSVATFSLIIFQKCFQNRLLLFLVLFPAKLTDPQRGWLISFGRCRRHCRFCACLFVTYFFFFVFFQRYIKMPGSAGYRGASSLLSAHFSPTDFYSTFF